MNYLKLTFVLSLLGVGMLPSFTHAQSTIKVALSTALTGPVSQYGEMHRGGVRAAIENINKQGGVLGKKIEIVEMDDACHPKQTIAVAEKVVSEKINFVLGPLCSGTVASAAKIYEQNKVVMIAPTASSDSLSELGHRLFFRTIGKDSQQATAVAQYIAQKIKPAALAIIHENQAYGEGLAQQARKVVEANGIKPVLFEKFTKGDKDFLALINKFKENKVDYVYYGGYHPELLIMLKQAEDAGLTIRWAGAGGIASPALKGELAEGVLVSLPPDVSANHENAKANEMLNAMGIDPSGAFVMTSFASAQILAAAIEQAASDDAQVVAELMHTQTFKTVLGDVRFSASGDNAAAMFDVFVWHKDASKTLAP